MENPHRFLLLEQVLQVWKYKLSSDMKKKVEEREPYTIYVDSPFCFSPECSFCIYKPNILSTKEIVNARNLYYDDILIENIHQFSEILKIRLPDSIYFGGGTSTLMTVLEMKRIFDKFNSYFSFKDVKEKCFECNPLNTTDEKLSFLLDNNFNFFSFGIQSFNEDVLKFNKRKNPPIGRIKEIFNRLESADVMYNADIMMFIYRDDLDGDIAILRKDLDMLAELKPRRITIFPNYKKFNLNDSNSIKKIRAFRLVVQDFINKGEYQLIHGKNLRFDSFLETGTFLLMNAILIRKDVSSRKKVYNSNAPWYPGVEKNNTLAFGGFLERKTYSYIGDKFVYLTQINETGISYDLKFAKKSFIESAFNSSAY